MFRSHLFFCALLALLCAAGSLAPRAFGRDQRLTSTARAGQLLVSYTAQSTPADRERVARRHGGTVVQHIARARIDVLEIPALRNGVQPERAAAVMEEIARDPAVANIEPNAVWSIAADPRDVFLPLVTKPGAFLPNDPEIDRQYALTTILAYDAWASGFGSDGIVIAVVDTGVDLQHPDLRDKLVPGYDFVGDDSVPQDEAHHGTHVAGIAAAATDNNIGVAGICPACKIMPVRVLDAGGNGYTSDVVAGIYYAVDRGAQVVNLSLGGRTDSQAVRDAVNNAWNRGALVTCAAGNQGSSLPTYPAYYDNCLAVGWTGSDDAHDSRSNYGPWVDLAAPGSSIYSTLRGGYGYMSGTSMATPLAAGVAGMLAGQGLSNQQIRSRLEAQSDPIGGTGVYWSNGRLNMLRAIRGY